jgi:hypothetical protein
MAWKVSGGSLLIGELVSGEPWWDRTTDPLIKSQVLSQLS